MGKKASSTNSKKAGRAGSPIGNRASRKPQSSASKVPASAREVVAPDGEISLDKDGARAWIQFASRDAGWIAEFMFILPSGSVRGRTLPLTARSEHLPSEVDALAHAAQRMMDAASDAVDGLDLSKVQKKALAALQAWADGLILHSIVPLVRVRKPLEGKRFADLFAGVGGFHVAMKAAGAECAGAVEIDPQAQETYRENHPGDYPIWPDIRTAVAAMFGHVDIVCGGFPCQSFSVAGDGKGFDDPEKGALFFDVARLIGELGPSVAILENVEGLCQHDEGRTFEAVLRTLASLGYSASADLLDSGQFGLPQVRKRLYLVCIHDRVLASRTTPYVFPKGMDASAVVEDILEADHGVEPCDRPVKRTKPDPVRKSLKIEVVGLVDGKNSQGYRVASPRGKGFTLCANSGGVGAKTGLYLVGGKPRKLSPRECARMQGFPESFKPHPLAAVARRQFGNSVATTVVSAIAEQLGNTF